MAYERRKQRGIHHVCLRVSDLKKAADFYIYALDAQLVCEWGPDGSEDHAYILDLGQGDFLEIFESETRYDLGVWQHVAVWTDDIETSYRRALAYGGTEHAKPAKSRIPTRDGGVVRMAYAFVLAPGGELVEFIQDLDEEAFP